MDTTTSAPSGQTGLILDFGGVLTTPILDSVTAFEKREGLPVGAHNRLMHGTVAGIELLQAIESGAITQQDWNEKVGQLLDVPSDNLMGRIFADLRPSPKVINAAQVLRTRGVKVGVLTNSPGLDPFDVYAGYELETRYDALVISELERMRKPDPRMYQLMLDRLGLPASHCVMVDDIPENLAPARELGMTCLLAINAKQVLYDLQSLFDVELAS
ncbi:HAD family hydrolase [Streptacidiphilus sp. MAP5-52]|uniref:HAD family hydrolase n=1 Tax=Streptacidiphilus sp. MAP5-52 TaxID=3156267 RepID=UPI00351478D6